MAGFQTNNTDYLIRAQVWSSQLKELFEDDLMAKNYVDWITEFPDGDVLNIPSIGQMEVQDYEEGQAIKYTAMDTGNFQFRITEYKSSATYVTRKMQQDSFYMSRLEGTFVPRMRDAIERAMEVDILEQVPNNQVAGDKNRINGAAHRWVGRGPGATIALDDFAAAKFALKRANVPLTNLVAIVDPTVEYTINTLTNIVNVSNNPMWQGIVETSMSPTGMRFVANIYGFDVYVSNYLPGSITETIDGDTVNDGVANLFFSADSNALPIVGAVRQTPIVDAEFNKDLQREEYVVTARWGFGVLRPESACVVLTENHNAGL